MIIITPRQVWSGKARLPNKRRRWREHRAYARASGGIDSPQLLGIFPGFPIVERKLNLITSNI